MTYNILWHYIFLGPAARFARYSGVEPFSVSLRSSFRDASVRASFKISFSVGAWLGATDRERGIMRVWGVL